MNMDRGSLPQDRICAASRHFSAALKKSFCLSYSSVELTLVWGSLTHGGSRCPTVHGKVPIPDLVMLLYLLGRISVVIRCRIWESQVAIGTCLFANEHGALRVPRQNLNVVRTSDSHTQNDYL